MQPFRAQCTSNQLAEHLKKEIFCGRLTGTMPGIQHLVKTLGVSSAAATKAVRQLEHEGLIISQGNRRRRLITTDIQPASHSLRVATLHYDQQNKLRHDSLLIRQALIDAGHMPLLPPKTMQDLGFNTERIARMAESLDVDAWIIYAGSVSTLEWFSHYKVPAMAIYGRFKQIPMAGMGINKIMASDLVIEKLIQLGHRRIVFMTREERRKPSLGSSERHFLHMLESHGIKTGPYNIPDWHESPEGLNRCLDSLLHHTPPTAIFVSDAVLCHAIQLHLANRGFKSPEDISLFCDDYSDSFEWVAPRIAHLQWDHRPIVRRALQWAKNISQGKEDIKHSLTKAEFVDGETIGPAPKSRS